MDLNKAVVVVTGATRGIGRHVAALCAHAGVQVVVTGRSSESSPDGPLPGSVEATIREIEGAGGEAHGIVADAASMTTSPILDTPARRYGLAYQVNVVSLVELVQGLVPAMLERGGGRVLSVSSGASLSTGNPNFSVYGASKAALERLNDSLHAELGGRGVAFNTLRIDETVPTEMYVLSNKRGAVSDPVPDEAMYSPEQTAAAILWMIDQPPDWSGNCVGFEDLRRLGVLPPH